MKLLRALPWRTGVIAAAALIAAALPGTLGALCLQRTAFAAGELWRLLTCHLVHGSREHLLWDVLPLLILGVLFEPVLRGRTWTILGLSGLLVSSGVLLWLPEIESYAGLSGVLNGLWVGGALAAARVEERGGRRGMALVFRICVLADLAKIALELVTGIGVFTASTDLGGAPVPAAHAFGALGGLLILVPLQPGASFWMGYRRGVRWVVNRVTTAPAAVRRLRTSREIGRPVALSKLRGLDGTAGARNVSIP